MLPSRFLLFVYFTFREKQRCTDDDDDDDNGGCGGDSNYSNDRNIIFIVLVW